MTHLVFKKVWPCVIFGSDTLNYPKTMLYKLHQEKKVSGDNQSIAWRYADLLSIYLQDFLTELDQHLDKRLVRTFFNLLCCIIRFRDRHNGLVLSELGAYLLGPFRAAAGTKRISNLFRSPKWTHQLVDNYLFNRAKGRIKGLLAKGVKPLLLWDESVIEKPESWFSEGLGAVRSSKAKRLKRIKPGYYLPPSGLIHVPGFNWMGVVLSGLNVEASIVAMRWWSKRGKAKAHPSTIRDNLIYHFAKHLPKGVIHVLDRGFAGRPWLRKMFEYEQQFILRWPKRFKLIDEKGVEKHAWKFSIGRRSMDTTRVRNTQNNTMQKIGMLYREVVHPDWPDQRLYLLISRPAKNRRPWYLLTNVEINCSKDAWDVIFSYARRWKIEQVFRFAKTEMAMESPRLWFWPNRLKCMMIITLAIDFLFHLLQKGRTEDIEELLNTWCPRTGNRCRNTSTPIYRIRLALSHAWNYWLIQNSG